MERKRLEIDKKYVKNIAMAVGKDGETGPCRNNTVKNGEESSAKPGFFLQISTFPAVFNLAFLA